MVDLEDIQFVIPEQKIVETVKEKKDTKIIKKVDDLLIQKAKKEEKKENEKKKKEEKKKEEKKKEEKKEETKEEKKEDKKGDKKGDKKQSKKKTKAEGKKAKATNKKGKAQKKKIVEILYSFRNQVIETREEQNKLKAKYSKIDFSNPFIQKFLALSEIDEIYSAYNDLSFGDLIFQFPNPDFEAMKEREVRYSEALQVYDQMILVLNETMNQSQAKQERLAFLTAFLLLDNFEPRMKGSKSGLMNSSSIQENSKIKDSQFLLEQNPANIGKNDKADPNSNNINPNIPNANNNQNTEQIDTDKNNANLLGGGFEQNNKPQDLKKKNKKNNKQGSPKQDKKFVAFAFIDAIHEKFAVNKESQEEKQKIQKKLTKYTDLINQVKDIERDMCQIKEKNEQVIFFNEEQMGMQSEEKKEKFDGEGQQKQGDEENDEEQSNENIAHKKAVFLTNKEIIQKKHDKLVKLLIDAIDFNDHAVLNKLKKKYSHGRFLEMFSEGNFVQKLNKGQDYDWICANDQPRDFLTLIRFTIIGKLSRRANLHTRSFVSRDSKSIFLIVKGSDDQILAEASSISYSKQLEIGYADLLSLEPCDRYLRPLRCKNIIREQIADYQKTKQCAAFEPLDGKVTIESRVKKLMQEVNSKWSEDELWENIAKKQIQVDFILEKIQNELNFDILGQQELLLGDKDDLREGEWEAYYIYLEIFYELYYRFEKIKDNVVKSGEIKEEDNDLLLYGAFIYKLIFMKALKYANMIYHQVNGFFSSKQILKTIWDKMELDGPISPFSNFFASEGDNQLKIWRRYQSNELEDRTIFNNMDQIKLVNSIVLNEVNIQKLALHNYLNGYFAIHDQFELLGHKKGGFFVELRNCNLLENQEINKSGVLTRKLFEGYKQFAEEGDFECCPVLQETKFNICKPWYISLDSIRDYFGEKIALYFDFLSFLTRSLYIMAFIGIIVQIIQGTANDNSVNGINVFFGLVIIIWSTIMIELWKREEAVFRLKYGQDSVESNDQIRPSFEGYFQRSLNNDSINHEVYSEKKRKVKMLFSIVISLIIIGCVLITVYFIFLLKDYMVTEGIMEGWPIINSSSVPGILNTIQIMIFNAIYRYVSTILNEYENHETFDSYESSLVLKIFLFQFVNTFNSCFIIAFLSGKFEELDLCRHDNDEEPNCFTAVAYNIMSIFIVMFINNIPELMLPFVKAYQRKLMKKMDETPVIHPFNQIDYYIEEQSDLEPYMTNKEVDGTVGDYMELMIQYGFLILFGLAFPVSFVMALVNDIAEIQVDKYKICIFSQRPIPKSTKSLGSWFIILDTISFLSVFFNAGLIAYTSDSVNKDDQQSSFLTITSLFLAIKFILRFLIPDDPRIVQIIKQRQETQVDKLVKGLGSSKVKIQQPSRLNEEIGNVDYSNKHLEKTQKFIIQGPNANKAFIEYKKKQL